MQRTETYRTPATEEEDFGILPVEAQAYGTPVIAFGSGGALETVTGLGTPTAATGPATGVFFDRQTPDSLADAVRRFEAAESTFLARDISEHAADFSPERFKERLREEIGRALEARA